MALNLETKYPLNVDPATAEYPYGKARNVVTSGDGTGTPWEQDLINDIFGFFHNLLIEADIVPSNIPEKVGISQYTQALEKLYNTDVSVKTTISQVTHGFSIGDLLYNNAGTWELAQADSAAKLAQGIVSEVIDADTFVLVLKGVTTWTAHGLTIGQIYYLDASTPNTLTTTSPTLSQGVLLPLSVDQVIFSSEYSNNEETVSTKGVITQASHGFSAGDLLYNNAGVWTLAQSDTVDKLAQGIVEESIDINNFRIVFNGFSTWTAHGLTVGQIYYLDPATPNTLTTTAPAIPQRVVVPQDVNTILFQNIVTGGGGGGTSWTITEVQTGDLTAGEMWLADSSVARTRTLPLTPSTDDEIIVKDDTGTAATNNITIGRNGSTILGAAEDLIVDVDYAMVRLKYNGTTWKVVS